MGHLIIASNAVPSTSRNEEAYSEIPTPRQLYRRLEVGQRNPRVLLVTTAEPLGAMHPNNLWLRLQARALLGMPVDVMDWNRASSDFMTGYRCVIIAGGNTYRLAHALHNGEGYHSPATILGELMAAKPQMLVIGISAGGIICTPRIDSVRIQDPLPWYLKQKWRSEYSLGLSWYPREVFPHYEAKWRGGGSDEKRITAYEEETGHSVQRLKDGEYIVHRVVT
jgi:hypothetical protein